MILSPARLRPSWRGRAVIALAAAFIGGFLALTTGVQPASAHAVLVSSSPADGSRVDSSPAEVILRFDEPVQLVASETRVLGVNGNRVDAGTSHTAGDGSEVIIPLKPALDRGSYTVTWRVVSADTHIVSGSLSFGVRQSAAVPGAASATLSPLDVIAQLAVGLGYLGVILAFGVGVLSRTLWPRLWHHRRVRMLITIGLASLGAGALIDLFLQGPRAAESGLPGVIALDGMAQTLASPYGAALLCRLLLVIVLIILSRWMSHRLVAVSAAILAVGVLLTIALGGHAAAGSDVPLALSAAVAHLAAMAVWAAGILLLLLAVLPALRTAEDLSWLRLRSWSLLAFVSLAVLVVSGEYQAWRTVQPVDALWSTPYGATLLLKVGIVAVAGVVALVAQRIVLRDRGPHELPRLRRALRIEALAVAAALIATTVLTALPTPATSYGPAVTVPVTIGTTGLRADARFDTTRHGPLTITVAVKDADGAPVVVPEMTATLSSPANGVGAISVRLERHGDDWVSVGAVAPLAGEWTLQLSLGVDEAHAYTADAQLRMW